MYRLAISDDYIQEIVSREISAGFRYAFEMTSDEYEVKEEALKKICSKNKILKKYTKNKDNFILIKHKVEKMLKEVEDKENEYTFDCFGEYILYVLLKYTAKKVNIVEHGREKNTWNKHVSLYEWQEVTGRVYKYMARHDKFNENWAIDVMIVAERILNFPLMLEEITKEDVLSFDLLFWDRDFLWFEDADVEIVMRFIDENKDTFGLVEATDNNEPESGSLKVPMAELTFDNKNATTTEKDMYLYAGYYCIKKNDDYVKYAVCYTESACRHEFPEDIKIKEDHVDYDTLITFDLKNEMVTLNNTIDNRILRDITERTKELGWE